MPPKTFLEFYWAEPEAEIIEQHLIGLALNLDNMAEPMAGAAYITAEDIRERFRTGTDPSGEPWDEWAESYEPWAVRHSTGRIFGDRANLHLTGELRDAATSPDSFIPTDEGLFLDTSDLPEYWAWNNFGAERSVGAGGESAASIKAQNIAFRRAAGRGVAGFGSLTGENLLPERPFVGLSEKARAKIIAAFDAWFLQEVELAQSTKGKTFFRHSKRIGGRFAKRS
jgi:hypothetical protein